MKGFCKIAFLIQTGIDLNGIHMLSAETVFIGKIAAVRLNQPAHIRPAVLIGMDVKNKLHLLIRHENFQPACPCPVHKARKMLNIAGTVYNAASEMRVVHLKQPDIDGFYSKNPETDKDAKLIPLVEEIDEELLSLAGGAGSKRGTGGMKTKLNAAKMVTDAGINMFITNGCAPENIYDILEGKQVGTLFKAKE